MTCSPGTIGLTFQMSRQYSRIERSDEKRPTRALLRIDMRVQRPAIAIGVADALLAVDVGLIVGQQHVVVARQQRIDERAEQLAIAVGEEPAADQVDRLAQLGVRS